MTLWIRTHWSLTDDLAALQELLKPDDSAAESATKDEHRCLGRAYFTMASCYLEVTCGFRSYSFLV
ncbi:MAG: hypothetical protein IPI90_14380 [Saprospiraceae bacterium]|nr:hypothetical protein [Candidatus Vicinibacter affinis]